MPFSNLRYATPEEVETIKDHADLGPGCLVLAWPDGDKPPVLAVVRQPVEVDPVFFPEGFSNQRKLAFVWVLENALKFSPLSPNAYYFNVHAGEEEWRSTLEKLGAQATSTEPEFRYKKVIS